MGNNDLSIGGLTIGIDANGMETYQDNLKVALLDKTCEVIDNVSMLEAIINAGWQGVSRDRFLKSFQEMRTRINEDLVKEYADLRYRLSELQSNYFKQDQDLIPED